MSTVPADYPPPFVPSDYVVTPRAAEDERIDVGVLIVGAGPAGLATAVRLGQLLAEEPALAEQLGEVPIAVAEKGKAPGSHLLSGAVMRPGPITDLFPGVPREEIPNYGVVSGEAVYFMTSKAKIRIPTPPQMKNHGNWVVSISQLARWMSAQAEELGAYMLRRDRLPEDHRGPGPRDGRASPATRAGGGTARSWRPSSRAPSCTPRSRCSPRARRAT